MFKNPVFPNFPILLVEESIFARQTVRGMLEQSGLRHVIEAEDGTDALNRLTQFKPSLILLDWEVSGISAAQILGLLRDPSRSTETCVPVIIMSATPTRKLVDLAAESNVRHILRKPFSPKALWQRISDFIPTIDAVEPRADKPFSSTPEVNPWKAAGVAG